MCKSTHYLLFLILTCCTAPELSAQHRVFEYKDCPEFPQQSPITKIFAVPSDSVLKTIFNNYTPDAESMLFQKVFCTLPDADINGFLNKAETTAGYYMSVRLEKNNVIVNRLRKQSFNIEFIDLGNALLMEVRDMQNQPDKIVTVRLRGKDLAYSEEMKGFVLTNLSNEDEIIVRKGNDICYYTAWVQRIPKQQPYRQYQNEAAEKIYKGYMVTNKPKYMPGDTVKWKAYLLDPFTGKPVTEPLQLVMTDGYVYYRRAGTLPSMTKRQRKAYNAGMDQNYYHEQNGRRYVTDSAVMPAAPGVYFDEFVVADSMDMDRTYNLVVTGHKTATRLSTQIRTEDYLLQDLKLKVKAEENLRYQKGDIIKLFVYAATANNLPLLDGNITVTILPQHTYVAGDWRFPDTIFHAEVAVDPTGENSFTASLKDMPLYDNNFRCMIHVQNSSNDTKDTLIAMKYTGSPYYIQANQKGNKVQLKMIQNKKSVPATGHYLRNYDTAKIAIQFPTEIEVSAYDNVLRFVPDTAFGSPSKQPEYFQLANDGLSATDEFYKDTAYLYVSNPQKAHFRFAVYVGQKSLGVGQTKNDTVLKIYSPKGETVTINSHHYWKGAQPRTFTIHKFDKSINIDLRKKDLIYPGQQDSISVILTDMDGNAIKNTNLTVLAFNEQFEHDNVPDVPNAGVLRPGKEADEMHQINPRQALGSISFKLADDKWVYLMNADSIFLYREILMNKRYTTWIRNRIAQNRPQMAVHIKENGDYQVPEIIYVDNVPVFYRRAGNYNGRNHNSFMISKGAHVIRVRLYRSEYVIYNVNIKDSTKLTVYVNGDMQLPNGVMRQERPNNLTNDEMLTLSQYYIVNRSEYSPMQHYNYDVDGNLVYDDRATQKKQYRRYMDNNIVWFQQGRNSEPIMVNGRQEAIVGPFMPGIAVTFYQYNNTRQTFIPEQNQLFVFREGMIRVEKINFANYVRALGIETYWPELCYLAPRADLDTFEVRMARDTMVPQYYIQQVNQVREPGSLRATVSGQIYGWTGKTNIPGRVLLFKKKNKTIAAVAVRPDGYFELNEIESGHYSLEIDNGIKNLILTDKVRIQKDSTTMLYFRVMDYRTLEEASPARARSYQISERSSDQSAIEGMIQDEKGEPVPGAIIEVISGGIKRGGAVTDIDGQYNIRPLAIGNYEVIVRYAGYSARRVTNVVVALHKAAVININLLPNTLEEVVIKYERPLIADGAVRNYMSGEDIKHMPTINMATVVSNAGPGLRTTGRGDINAGGQRAGGTVTFIDGIQVVGNVPNLNQGVIEEIGGDRGESNNDREPVEYADAREFMGSAKTQKFIDQFMSNQLLASGVRKNFRDWAIWEPNLWTDKDGISRFSVTYPDNITAWRTYVLAMNEKGFGGRTMRLTHAFKPLSAQLSLPRFLRYGDTAWGVGKISNYTQQAFELRSSFVQDGREKQTENVTVNNVKVDALLLEAPQKNRTDTGNLGASYSIQAANGFTDGEEKKIPVYFVGTRESRGSFDVMNRDTTIYYRPDTGESFTGKTWVMIDGSLLDVMLREIENLKVYPYGCTEQLTTKLLAISYEERVKKIMSVDTVNNAGARDSIVKKLIQLQNPDGSFGWWNEKSPDYRISNYVLSTMQKIDPAFRSALIVQRGLQFLDRHLPLMQTDDRVASLRTLSEYGYATNYEAQLAGINDTTLSIHNKFAIATVRKQQKMPYRYLLDTLMKQANKRNGLHWGEFNYDWYRNDISTTVMAYKLVENDPVYAPLKDKIVEYLLFSRRNGYYRNTAEAGQILTTLLPGLLANSNSDLNNRYTSVVISGSINDTIKEFPKKYERVDKNIHFSVSKMGISPAFVSVVYDHMSAQPEIKDSIVAIRTDFIKGYDTLMELQAGTKVTLRVTVNCDTPMSYMMIEVPIPAGCAQAGQEHKYNYSETNRENYKDKTIIYCSQLNAGQTTFDIPLEVRYKGSYHMNPARAAMMYYPDKYGNNEVKVVKIR